MSCALDDYPGFEQGSIRPTTEVGSLLIRVTRNCPWNRCTFCDIYKGKKFSFRPVEHVLQDIDSLYACVQDLRAGRNIEDGEGETVNRECGMLPSGVRSVSEAALAWFRAGMDSVFLQDGEALALRTEDLVKILTRLREFFPDIRRITSYTGSKTILNKSVEDLKTMCQAGLNRVHVGLESGSDAVLALAKKGITGAQHIEAGLKAKEAGIELSEYVMPGLGGQALSHEHAVKTAEVLNAINPDFIRLRTLLLTPDAPLFHEWEEGRFLKCSQVTISEEIRSLIAHLDGITSTVESNIFLNIITDLDGRMPQDKALLLSKLDRFLALDPHKQMLFQVGRRLGLICHVEELEDALCCTRLEAQCISRGITLKTVDEKLDSLIIPDRRQRPLTEPARPVPPVSDGAGRP